MGVNADGAEHQAAAPAQRGDESGLARTDPLKPAAPDRGSGAEQHEEQRVHPAEAGDLPVASRGEQFGREAHAVADLFRRGIDEGLRQRQPEHTEAVGHADAQMNAERGWRHEPAIESRLGDDALTVQQTGLRADR